MQERNWFLLFKRLLCASMQLSFSVCMLISLEPVSGGEKVHKFLSGLKPELKKLCLVDPSHQDQIWAGCDYDKLVTFALTMDINLASIPNSSPQGTASAHDAAKPSAQKGIQKRKFAQMDDWRGPSGASGSRNQEKFQGWQVGVFKPSYSKMATFVKGSWYCQDQGYTPIDHHFRKCKAFEANGIEIAAPPPSTPPKARPARNPLVATKRLLRLSCSFRNTTATLAVLLLVCLHYACMLALCLHVACILLASLQHKLRVLFPFNCMRTYVTDYDL
jgi:hypothetical protein